MIKAVVTIVVPSFKMGHIIDKALESISVQSSLSWELIVVDDFGPQDGTKDAVEKFSKKHLDHRVKYIRHKKNSGVSAARNTGIKFAQGKVIAFLDPDDWWTKDHLKKSLEIFEHDLAIDVVTGPIINFCEKTKKLSPWPLSKWMIQRFPASLAANNFIQPSATLVKTAALKKIGGFDTSRELNHIEDYDLWIRLAEAGEKFGFRKEITCFYRRHDGAASADREKMELLHRNLVAKHRGFFLNAQRELISDLMHRSVNLHYLNRSPLFQVYVYLFKSLKKTKDNILKFLNG